MHRVVLSPFGVSFLLVFLAPLNRGGKTMLPMKALRLKLGVLLAADVPTLAPVAANKVALVNAAFAPNEALTIASLSFATFTGSAPIAGAAGPQGVGTDPATEI